MCFKLDNAEFYRASAVPSGEKWLTATSVTMWTVAVSWRTMTCNGKCVFKSNMKEVSYDNDVYFRKASIIICK